VVRFRERYKALVRLARAVVAAGHAEQARADKNR